MLVKKNLFYSLHFSLFLSLFLLWPSVSDSAEKFIITKLGQYQYYDPVTEINDRGQVVFGAYEGSASAPFDVEIFLYDKGGITQLSSNDIEDRSPKINNQGKVVWSNDQGLYLYDQGKTVRVDSNEEPGELKSYEINNLGEIVYQKSEGWTINGRIYLYQNGSRSLISNPHTSYYPLYDAYRTFSDFFGPDINDLGQVTFSGGENNDLYGGSAEIFLYDKELIRITDNYLYGDLNPLINNLGDIAWRRRINAFTTSDDLFLYHNKVITQLTDYENKFGLSSYDLNDRGDIVWSAADVLKNPNSYDLYLYQGGKTSQITNSTDSSDLFPQINNLGHIIWRTDSSKQGISFYKEGLTTQVADNLNGPTSLRINDVDHICWSDDHKGSMLASPGTWEYLQYTFTFNYRPVGVPRADSYSGTVWAHWREPYAVNEYIAWYWGGEYPGWSITGISGGSDDSSLAGQVFVDSYYDAETDRTFTPVSAGTAVGKNYLGSERDYILEAGVPWFYFGNADNEADLGAAYAFSLKYNNHGGINEDSYTGVVYAPPNTYEVGQTYNSTSKNHTYAIIALVQYLENDDQNGQVFIDSYSDAESGRSFRPVGYGTPVGTGGLGSENDCIIKTGVADFSFSIWGEADLGAVYAFRCDYNEGKGDKYWGRFNASQRGAYNVGWISSFKDENDQKGQYEITKIVDYIEDPGTFGAVYVDSYFDQESQKTFDPLRKGAAVSTAYLGNESDSIVKDGVAAYKFGNGYDEADVGDRYRFRYYYTNGDYYQGYVYQAPSAAGYYVGQKIYKKNELGLNGYYQILSAEWSGEAAKYGQVYVDYYKDAESGKGFLPLHKGIAVGKSLGSEQDYIVKGGVPAYNFGQGYYQADVGDKYLFRYYYTNGDYYQGYVYQAPSAAGYYVGQKIYKKNELGLNGYYQILSAEWSGEAAKYGQVYVDYYKDGESAKGFIPLKKGTAAGTAYLRSEWDYIIKDGVAAYKFGNGYYEADASDTFTFRYSFGNGDYYEGIVYRAPSQVYYNGWKLIRKNELNLNGSYAILKMDYTGKSLHYKKVFVTRYYDAESKKTYEPLHKGQAVGDAYLGSEQDYIIKDGVGVYKFGQGYYEADVGDQFKFRYVYGNGDYYDGSVYQAPSATGYYPGQKIYKKNELGLTGYYYIISAGWSGETAKYGKVYVDWYYDGNQTKKSYRPLNYLVQLGSAYLGSEAGYILSAHPVRSFGKGFSEADAFFHYVGNFHGVAYGPFRRPGESPETGEFPTEPEIITDLGIIAKKFTYVRTYGLDGSLKTIVPLASKYYPKLKFMIGVYETGGSQHATLTKPQLDTAIQLANTYSNVMGVVVGNECLPGDPTPVPVALATLEDDLKYVRAGITRPGVAVTTSLTYAAAKGAMGKALEPYCDVMMINIHPFYAPVKVEEAVTNLRGSYNLFQTLYDPKAKQVLVGETGWPSTGPANGSAIPSVANEEKFVRGVYQKAGDLTLFYFEMFDEPWKHENLWANHWGLYDCNGVPKFPLPW